MRSIAKVTCVIVFVSQELFATPTLAASPKGVTVYADEANYATDQSLIHEATCPSGKYRLRISQNDNRVELEIDGAARAAVDLSNTNFGVTFLNKSLHGKFYSTCPDGGGVRVYFYGVEPATGAELRPVKYRITFDSGGAISRDDGLRDTPAESINFWFTRRTQQ